MGILDAPGLLTGSRGNLPNGFTSKNAVASGTSRQITAKPPTDTDDGVFDWKHDSASGDLLHLVMGANTTASSTAIAIGMDQGSGFGLLVSCKNAGNGVHIGHNPSATGYGVRINAYGLFGGGFIFNQYKTAAPVVFQQQDGQGFPDGQTVNGSPSLASATAAFVAGDAGQAVSQLTNINGAAIPAGTTINSVATTTIASGSNAVSLPTGTVNVASTTGFAASGVVMVTTGAGAQIVTYTGVTGTSFTGCTGGTGAMSTGGAVGQAVMSQNATFTTSTTSIINFLVAGRQPTSGSTLVNFKDRTGSSFLSLTPASIFVTGAAHEVRANTTGTTSSVYTTATTLRFYNYNGSTYKAHYLTADATYGYLRAFPAATKGAEASPVNSVLFGESGGSPIIGFLGTTPTVKATITGSRGGNAALTALLTELAAKGLITDGTSA